MKNDDYLLVLSGSSILREVELPHSSSLVRVGTSQRCDVRFRKESFFSAFELEFVKDDDGQWEARCSDEVYFSVDGIRRLAVLRLEHGSQTQLKYADSNSTLLSLHFSIDFERERGGYDRCIDLSDLKIVTLGGMQNCNIRLNGPYTEGDLFTIQRENAQFVVVERTSRYGIYFDGKRMNGRRVLEDMSFLSVANFYFYFKDMKLYCSKTADITFSGVRYFDEPPRCLTSEYPLFNRNTRIKKLIDDEKIGILDPPKKQEAPRSNIVLKLLPAVGMLAVVVLLRGSLMTSSNSQAFILISACSICVGIFASVLGIVSERRRYRKETQERETKYQAYIEEKRKQIEEARSAELALLKANYPSVDEEFELMRRFSGDLFDRRPADEDFLHVRLGLGERPAARVLEHKHREELEVDELAEIPERLCEEYRMLEDAPICVSLAKANAVGVVGPQAARHALMRIMVVDLCSRQYEKDVKLFFVVSQEHESLVHWARMIPHVQNEPLNARNIVCDEESKNILFEFLYKELTAREAQKDAVHLPWLVVFVIDECGLKNHPLSRFIDSATSLGVSFVFFERYKEHLPLGCDWIVTVESEEEQIAHIVDSQNDRSTRGFAYETANDYEAAAFAKALAPVYCEEISLEGTLTKNISLFEMLGIISADDIDLARRWKEAQVVKSLSAPLGVSKAGTVYLDLHDKAHGPHGLVAGTTGSGKSEILQTYVLSIATLFHPYEVSFVIIDFKGGGMANQFRTLPHLVGAITNIDGREIDRSLKSIKAELRKRQRSFAEAGVNHINDYIKKFKKGEVGEPLPHLVIIVDEFAELKAEQPEFMKELISASRIGRSLGVHLILATQKPAGQVSDQIWSNSRFKLCLKVQSKEDSNEVLKSPLAAEIKEPGRAYLQVGNNEIFELFQSAFSGAPERENEDDTKEFALYELANSGKRIPVFQKKRQKATGQSVTQLEAIVSHVAGYCERAGIAQLPSICLPSLDEVIPYPERTGRLQGSYALGVYDDPDNQYQGEARFDLEGSNVLVIGATQMGKTNILQTMIRAIASVRTPDQDVIYVMDFASMALKGFEELAHVGGIVLPSEDEKLKNLFKLLNEQVAQRKKRLLEVGVSSFAAYREAGYSDLPHIHLLIDNFAVFKELYQERFEGDLLAICRDGIAYGITVVVANSSTAGFGYKYLSHFSTFIALTCNDSSEYAVVFDRCRMQPREIPGRALFSLDKTVYEFQAYLGFEGEREVDRVAAMKDFVAAANARSGGARARRIPSVPDELSRTFLRENYDIPLGKLGLGLDYATVEPVCIDLGEQFSLSLVGDNLALRRSTLSLFMEDLIEVAFDNPVEAYIVDDLDRSMASYKNVPIVAEYHSDYSAVDLLIGRMETELMERRQAVAEHGFEVLNDRPYKIVFINSEDAMLHISEEKELLDAYQRMAKQCMRMRVLFVFGAVPNATVSFSSPALLKTLKDEQRALVLSNMDELKFFDANTALSRRFREPLAEGQAFLFASGDVRKVKLAVSDEAKRQKDPAD